MKSYTPEQLEAFRRALIAARPEDDDDGMGGTYLLGWLLLIFLMIVAGLAFYGLSTCCPGVKEIFPVLRG